MSFDSGVAPIDDPTLGVGDGDPEGFPHVLAWDPPSVPSRGGGPRYGELIGTLRTFLDHVAAARPDEGTITKLSADLSEWIARLAPQAVSEREQLFAHRLDLIGHGQTMVPAFIATRRARNRVEGTVRFGRYYLGGNGAVHGGAVQLLFDDVLGRLANSGDRSGSRTAYLHTDFHLITPVGPQLSVRAWFVSEEGRKRLLRGELRHGETVCATTEGLWVALRPGQP